MTKHDLNFDLGSKLQNILEVHLTQSIPVLGVLTLRI